MYWVLSSVQCSDNQWVLHVLTCYKKRELWVGIYPISHIPLIPLFHFLDFGRPSQALQCDLWSHMISFAYHRAVILLSCLLAENTQPCVVMWPTKYKLLLHNSQGDITHLHMKTPSSRRSDIFCLFDKK